MSGSFNAGWGDSLSQYVQRRDFPVKQKEVQLDAEEKCYGNVGLADANYHT